MSEQVREASTFKQKTIENLEELFNISNGEEVVENPKEYAKQVRNKLNWHRELLQYLEMYMEWSEKEILKEKLEHKTIVWNKGPFYRSDWWKMRRDEILERDNYKCQNCGLSNKEQKQKGETNRGLEVHHIKKRLDFSKEERGEEGKAHNENNLITLCTKCHANLETRKPERQREILDFPKQ